MKLIRGDANVLFLVIALLERGYYIVVSTFMKWCSGGNIRCFNLSSPLYYMVITEVFYGFYMVMTCLMTPTCSGGLLGKYMCSV